MFKLKFIDDEQKRLYEAYDFIQTEYSNDYAHKVFVYGYKLGYC